jgi:hypothetical protein
MSDLSRRASLDSPAQRKAHAGAQTANSYRLTLSQLFGFLGGGAHGVTRPAVAGGSRR